MGLGWGIVQSGLVPGVGGGANQKSFDLNTSPASERTSLKLKHSGGIGGILNQIYLVKQSELHMPKARTKLEATSKSSIGVRYAMYKVGKKAKVIVKHRFWCRGTFYSMCFWYVYGMVLHRNKHFYLDFVHNLIAGLFLPLLWGIVSFCVPGVGNRSPSKKRIW